MFISFILSGDEAQALGTLEAFGLVDGLIDVGGFIEQASDAPAVSVGEWEVGHGVGGVGGLLYGLRLEAEVLLVGYGVTAFFLFLGGVLAALVAVDGVGPLAEEFAQGGCDDKRVNASVEPAVSSRLEPMEEQHQLRNFQIVEVSRYHACTFLQRLALQLVPASAVLR